DFNGNWPPKGDVIFLGHDETNVSFNYDPSLPKKTSGVFSIGVRDGENILTISLNERIYGNKILSTLSHEVQHGYQYANKNRAYDDFDGRILGNYRLAEDLPIMKHETIAQ